tara:strand:+ start:274 stop:591 length:318 start_codon:yes stop_codon:yes gene_type:complete
LLGRIPHINKIKFEIFDVIIDAEEGHLIANDAHLALNAYERRRSAHDTGATLDRLRNIAALPGPFCDTRLNYVLSHTRNLIDSGRRIKARIADGHEAMATRSEPL